MNNIKLKNIAEKVLLQVPDHGTEKCGSVIAILMIISIILTVIRVLQECNKSKLRSLLNKNQQYDYFGSEIKQTAMRRSWFTKRTIKKAIKRELTPDAYKAYGVDLMNAILNTGENLSEDELKTLMEAANV
jgi:hypothetical protein